MSLLPLWKIWLYVHFHDALQNRGTETGKTTDRIEFAETEGNGLTGGNAAAAELTRGAREITADVRREDERKGGFD